MQLASPAPSWQRHAHAPPPSHLVVGVLEHEAERGVSHHCAAVGGEKTSEHLRGDGGKERGCEGRERVLSVSAVAVLRPSSPKRVDRAEERRAGEVLLRYAQTAQRSARRLSYWQ